MSVITLLSKTNPTIDGLSFDATLSQNFESEIEVTQIPVESGVTFSDHRIYKPRSLTMTMAIGSQELIPQLTDFLAGGLSNLTRNSGIISAAAGLSAAFLAGSQGTRASTALLTLLDMQANGYPATVDTGMITLSNMVIQRIRQTRTPENETGLEVEITMVEMVTLERLPGTTGQPKQAQLSSTDVSSTSITATVKRGLIATKEAATSVANQVQSLLNF